MLDSLGLNRVAGFAHGLEGLWGAYRESVQNNGFHYDFFFFLHLFIVGVWQSEDNLLFCHVGSGD